MLSCRGHIRQKWKLEQSKRCRDGCFWNVFRVKGIWLYDFIRTMVEKIVQPACCCAQSFLGMREAEDEGSSERQQSLDGLVETGAPYVVNSIVANIS